MHLRYQGRPLLGPFLLLVESLSGLSSVQARFPASLQYKCICLGVRYPDMLTLSSTLLIKLLHCEACRLDIDVLLCSSMCLLYREHVLLLP